MLRAGAQGRLEILPGAVVGQVGGRGMVLTRAKLGSMLPKLVHLRSEGESETILCESKVTVKKVLNKF